MRSRSLLDVLAVVALAIALSARPAAAATAQLEVVQSESGPLAQLTYSAARGEANRVRVDLESADGVPTAYLLRDPGITPGAGCSATASPTTVRCPLPSGTAATGPLLELSDRNDRAVIEPSVPHNATVLGGSGRDSISASGRLVGGPDNDRLEGGDTSDLIETGPGEDSVSSGAGDDRIRARDTSSDQLDCGEGRDTALLDGFDLPFDCERSRRSAPGRAVAEGTDFAVVVWCPADLPRACVTRVSISTLAGRTLANRLMRVPRGSLEFIDVCCGRVRVAIRTYRRHGDPLLYRAVVQIFEGIEGD